MLPSSLIARALSRLLAHDEGARNTLKPHAGSTLAVRMPPLMAALEITVAGDFAAADLAPEAEPTVAVDFPLTALPLLAQGQDAALRAARISGQAGLLRDVANALQSLPLAAEAELERFVGPIFANEAARLLAALKAFGDNAREGLHEATARYLKDEARLVATREEVARFAADIQRLRLDLERLEMRLARLG
ncbi:MAG: SCP2 domain-containing protein [Casimicrobiaceae bacterium]